MIVRGRVLDPQNRPVSGTSVFVVSAPVNMPDTALLTDDKGEFTISLPVEGRYSIGARSDEAGSGTTDLEVAGESPVDVTMRLEKLEEGQ